MTSERTVDCDSADSPLTEPRQRDLAALVDHEVAAQVGLAPHSQAQGISRTKRGNWHCRFRRGLSDELALRRDIENAGDDDGDRQTNTRRMTEATGN